MLLELGDVNEPMSLDKELEEEFVAPQHQVCEHTAHKHS
jgi:hypothetical protein